MMLNKLLDGFDGKLTTSKWMTRGARARDGLAGGRSTGYRIVIPDAAP